MFERTAAFFSHDGFNCVADAKLQYVISDERPIGFLLSCAEGWKSYDTDGRPIGLFDSEELAAKAVYEGAALPSPPLKT